MIECGNESFESLSSKEWLVTNGIGGYASGSISGANTRRYHGLLVASFNPPTDRKVIVSKVEETIISGDLTIPLSANQYPDAVHPQGFKKLKTFERDPLPVWQYEAGELSVTKTVYMLYGSNTTIMEYQNTSDAFFQLQIIPLLVYRDYHHLRHKTDEFEFAVREEEDQKLKIIPRKGLDPIYIFFWNGSYVHKSEWYHNFEYERERERGLDFHEDSKSIGNITFNLLPGNKVFLVFSTDDNFSESQIAGAKKLEQLRIESLRPEINDRFISDLVVSGDQFLVWRLSAKNHTLIAGYHWFTDWGRDTMIAMRGLVIATGKKEIAESIFLTFLQYLDDGMIPNRFPDHNEQPEYNNMDGTLWLFIALYEYYQKFRDESFIAKVFPSLAWIIQAHYNGTKYNIHVTGEGFLYGGEKNSQLTWMDAKVGDHVVTPRHGCPVEINALWYNALVIYTEFAKLSGKPVVDFQKKVEQTGASFRKYFMNEKGYLYDVVIPGEYVNDDIRPNQVYAVSLPFTPLSEDECKTVLQVIETHLYTGLGLRSLSPVHPDFYPVYTGNQWQRDNAYHNGTVWAFLWGEYAMAYMKVHHYSRAAKREMRHKAKALENHFYNNAGIYAISEIFDGENPLDGKGCIQQAWSIGMTIRALLEAAR